MAQEEKCHEVSALTWQCHLHSNMCLRSANSSQHVDSRFADKSTLYVVAMGQWWMRRCKITVAQVERSPKNSNIWSANISQHTDSRLKGFTFFVNSIFCGKYGIIMTAKHKITAIILRAD